MKNRRLLFFIVTLSVLWSSCVETTDSATNESTTQTPAYLSSTTEDLTSFVLATVTAESTALPTSTDVNSTSAIPICPKHGVQTSPSDDFGIPGTIVYQKDLQGLYTVGGDPLAYSKLPVSEEQKYFAFGFSPDGNWFAFSPVEYSSTKEIVFDSPKVILLSANGERIEHTFSVKDFTDELPLEYHFAGFSGYSHWISDTLIYAALYSMTSTSPHHIDDTSFKVLDPFAGVWREDLLEDLPEDSHSLEKGISPDLTRMLYEDRVGVVLKNLEDGREIWHDKALNSAVVGPLIFWSPDSETAAYANVLFVSPEERTVVLISRDGIAKPIMGPTLSLSELSVTDVRWSPDGHYLALLTVKDEELSVFIYDVEAEKYISQCPIAKYTDLMPKLIWSPDNRYLAYAGLDYPLIIMDVKSGETIKLADDAQAVGWSDKFPVTWP